MPNGFYGGIGSGQRSIERPGGRDSDRDFPRENTRDRIKRRVVAGLFWLVLMPAIVGRYFAVGVVAYALMLLLNPLAEKAKLWRRAVWVVVTVGGFVAVDRGVLSAAWYPVEWRLAGDQMLMRIGRYQYGVPTRFVDLALVGVATVALLWLLARGFADSEANGVKKAAMAAYGWFVLVAAIAYAMLRPAISPVLIVDPLVARLPLWAAFLRFGLPVIGYTAWVAVIPDLDRRQRIETLLPGISGVTFGQAAIGSLSGLFEDLLGGPLWGVGDEPQREPVVTQAEPETIRLETHKADGNGHRAIIENVPVSEREFDLFAESVLDGRSLSFGSWTGSGGPFTRQRYEALLDALGRAGLIRLIDPAHPRQGRELTPAGRGVLRRRLEG